MSFIFGKAPKAPAPPDPAATAAAQSQTNRETAIAEANLNRINQYTPEGSLEYTVVGTNPDGTPKFQSTQKYSPEQQAIYEGQNRVSRALTDTSERAIADVNKAYSTPWDTSKFNPMATSIQGGPLKYDYGSGGDIQKDLDYSSLGRIPGVDDFGTDAQMARDAVYKQATSRLDPRFEAEARQYASTLAGKGVSENSVAYRRAMDDFARNKNDAYNQAQLSSVEAGGKEQSRLFGLAMGARQQGASEIENRGQFHNLAQGQGESQEAARAGFYNQARGQEFGQNATNAKFGNEARAQQMQEEIYARNEPINRIATLMGTAGGVSAPKFADYTATNVANTDYSGLVTNNFNQLNEQYKAKLASRNATIGAAFGAAGGVGAAFAGK